MSTKKQVTLTVYGQQVTVDISENNIVSLMNQLEHSNTELQQIKSNRLYKFFKWLGVW